MKPAPLTLVMLMPLAAMAQTEVYGMLDANAPQQKANPFKRPADVGIDGPLGVVALGRQYNLIDETRAVLAKPLQDGAANLAGYTSERYDNTVRYQSSRSRSGIIGSMTYSLGESQFSSATNRAYGATLGYEGGKAKLRISYQRKENTLDATGASPELDHTARNALMAASYDFGGFVGYAGYGHSKGDISSQWSEANPYGLVGQRDLYTNSRDSLVGVVVPLGRATTLLASFIRKDDRGIADRDANQFAIGASYAFSRRSDVYAAFSTIQNRNGAGFTSGNATYRAINVGFRRAF
ncbi:porin [Duganella sp. FT50W]|uniref:Porin n=1 Tax=Duganella lactea TaxID=2692173 RepID=A0A6L8MJG5_9BURK|nr:porin [Duganella lactea]MYM83307.1 porin [Duganella lactea]